MNYEARDASFGWIGLTAASVVVVVLFGLWMGRLVDPGAAEPRRQTSFTLGSAQHPDILDDYARVEADAARRLSGYGWVERQAGIAHIPIERAMALVAAGAKPAPYARPPAIPWKK